MYPIFFKANSIKHSIRLMAALRSHTNDCICLKKFDGGIRQTSGIIAESKWIQKSLAGSPFSEFRRLLEVGGLLISLILPSFPLGLERAQIFALASTLNRERQNKSVFTHHQREQPRKGQRQYGLLQLGYIQSIIGVCCHMPSLPALRDPSDRFDLPDG